jgi:hypothetical protein
MKIVILKGEFTGEVVHGTMVRIHCKLCARATDDTVGRVPGSGEVQDAVTEMTRRNTSIKPEMGKWTRALEKAHTHPHDAMKAMIIAPVTLNGRPEGYQAVCCFYCRQTGAVLIERERITPHRFGFAAKVTNREPLVHARRRVEVTFITLLALDCALQLKPALRGATVVCAGASLQCGGLKSKDSSGEPRQDAHQVLRELVIDGQPLYELVASIDGFPTVVKKVVTYCHGVISHLDACYNVADGLVETHATVEMIELAHMILGGTLRKSSGASNEIFGRLLWRYVLIRYRYAIQMGIIDCDRRELTQVLQMYLSVVNAMIEEGPGESAVCGLDALCDKYSSEISIFK